MAILINAELCTGCRLCELICSFAKHDEFNPKRSRIKIAKVERLFVDIPVVCRQCPDQPCVTSCPSDALRKDDDDTIRVNNDACTGCGSCRDACSFGAIVVDPLSNAAVVCDLCQGDPQCVKWCPTGALVSTGAGHPLQGKNQDSVIATARSLLSKWGIAWEEYEKYYGEAAATKALKSKEAAK